MQSNRLLILGAVCLFIAAFFSTGFHHFDEHFQLLEFANMKLGNISPDALSWEYDYQIRPTLQPAIAVASSRFLSFFGIDGPFALATFLRLLSGLFSFILLLRLWRIFQQQFSTEKYLKWFLLLSCFTWFIVYNNIRFSSENWSATCFLFGMSYFIYQDKIRTQSLIWAGLFLGLSFTFRFQVGFMVFGLFAWLLIIKKLSLSKLMLLFASMCIAIGAGVLVDFWFYGEWTSTAWNYFTQNIVEDKVSGFGVEPVWYYISESFIVLVPPFSIVFILPFVLHTIFKWKSIWTWVFLPFLLVHFIIGHKEIRFIYPVIGLLPFMVVEAHAFIEKKWDLSWFSSRAFKVFISIFWGVNLVFLGLIMFKSADPRVGVYQFVYEQEPVGVVFWTNKNPYETVLPVTFYSDSNLSVRKLDANLVEPGDLIIASRPIANSEIDTANIRLIYQSLPHWVTSINIGGWTERTDIWRVYRVTNP